MRRELEDIAKRMRTRKLIFEDDDFEDFLWKYAVCTMKFEGITVDGKQKGYMHYLMKQKAMDMLRMAEFFYRTNGKPVNMGKFQTGKEISEMVRYEHMCGVERKWKFDRDN